MQQAIRHSGNLDYVLFECEADNFKAAVERAVANGVNLYGASLVNRDLAGADLHEAHLVKATLIYSRLAGANLRYANLSNANLHGVDLTDADLTGAILSGTRLDGTTLEGTDLRRAHLEKIRQDFREVLSRTPDEVGGLRDTLIAGRIDGSCYEGECACLVGTIANLRGCDYDEIVSLRPDYLRPAERWFYGIRPGDTPENSQIAAITLEWIDEYMRETKPQVLQFGDLAIGEHFTLEQSGVLFEKIAVAMTRQSTLIPLLWPSNAIRLFDGLDFAFREDMGVIRHARQGVRCI